MIRRGLCLLTALTLLLVGCDSKRIEPSIVTPSVSPTTVVPPAPSDEPTMAPTPQATPTPDASSTASPALNVVSKPYPFDGAAGVSTASVVVWSRVPGYGYTYDVYFGTVGDPHP